VSVVRFKFLCNILISGKIIKEMPGSVASGTPYIKCHRRKFGRPGDLATGIFAPLLYSTLLALPDCGRTNPSRYFSNIL